ncbi:MAG: hypothetical protein U1F35_20960 [Steroidobacteraceae bacterium]
MSALATPRADSSVDDRNPWLGLASFTEETREYFHGREEEVAELARRVQRKLLTVLFGQSGLGKTSILRAGLVPRLRSQGYCPVYVRIDYARDAPEPAEQIKQAIARTAQQSGQWTQAGVAVEGESLWEFLHHRDDVLRDAGGQTIIPLLIFDQFEEIFTLAQTDDFGRARAARFIADLADLVENRPPKELEARLEHDDSAAEQFDFARGDYRVLIALREDYLAPLEGLKAVMPSITQNRLRLARMTGAQALAAVMRPGKGLVTQDVAEAIVRFVAGGAELANAEVEPSLLSLICRELNDARIAQGRGEISLDLLEGSRASILSNFYERALADQPPAVRRIIEDELLTESGFRENVAEEKLTGSFVAAGAAPDTLAVLVNRRLLRIEERLDVRRVELTHDVLCGVVKTSRDLRHEREARDASERQLAEQRAREQAARKAMMRARQVATFCVALALGAIAAAILAYVSTQRAHRAERQAQETRQLAERARGQAEQLLGYLTEDFSHEMESVGRQDVLSELARRQVEYFTSLPDSLKGPDTRRNGGLAMVQYAAALRRLGRNDDAGRMARQAIVLLEDLRRQGDGSERSLIALAKAYDTQASILSEKQSPDTLPSERKGLALLKVPAEAPGASTAVRRANIELLTGLAYQLMRVSNYEAGHEAAAQAMAMAERSGAADPANTDMAALYLYAAAWDVQDLFSLGRNEEAIRLGNQAYVRVDQVLAHRPNHLLALKAQQLIGSNLGYAALDDLRLAEATVSFKRALASSQVLSRLDPNNRVIQFNLGVTVASIGDALWQSGQVREGLVQERAALAYFSGPRKAGFVSADGFGRRGTVYTRSVDVGDTATLGQQRTEIALDMDFLARQENSGSALVETSRCIVHWIDAEADRIRSRDAEAFNAIEGCVGTLHGLKVKGDLETFARQASLFYGERTLGEAAQALGRYEVAEKHLRAALEARKTYPLAAKSDFRDQGEASTWLAMALAARGRMQEARSVILPVVAYERKLQSQNHGDVWVKLELATALYAQSLCEEGQRSALRREAKALIDSLPEEMRSLLSVRRWQARIASGSPT